MNRDDMNHDKQWEDIVRRLGGSEEQAKAEPAFEDPANTDPMGSNNDEQLRLPGPRDYTLAEEEDEDFLPPEPKPVSTANPRTLLSWLGVCGATVLWIVAGLGGWQLPWWLMVASTLSFIAGALSLFFLLPKTRDHRPPFDDDDFGDGAKV